MKRFIRSKKLTWWIGFLFPLQVLYGVGCWKEDGNPVLTHPISKDWVGQSLVDSLYFYAVSAVDANTAFASGEDGLLAKTVNGGKSWQIQVSNTILTLGGLSAWDGNIAIATGYNEANKSVTIKTSNGGASWTQVHSASSGGLNAIDMLSPQVAITVGLHGSQFLTLDGGTTWTSASFTLDGWLTGVQLLAESSWVAVGSDWKDDQGGYITKTSKDGNRYVTRFIRPADSLPGLKSVSFVDARVGWAVGLNGTILKTTDGGLTWVRQISGTTHSLFSVSAVNTETAFAMGIGVSLRTLDGGENWTQKTDYGSPLFIVSAVDRNLAFAAGRDGFLARTTTGGVSD